MENKPVCEIEKNGTKRWYLGDLYHREDGPAVEYTDGDKEWWINGRRHRLDGPAVEYDTAHSWYINGVNITDEIYQWSKKNGIDLANLSDYDKNMIKLIWADYEYGDMI